MTIQFPRHGILPILVLLAALGLGLYLVNQEQGLGSGVWPAPEAEAVQAIEIATRSERFALVREASGWVVRGEGAEPDALPVPADQAKVDALVAAIAHSRPIQNLGQVPQADQAGFGLAEPYVRILLRHATAGGKAEALLTFGHETPAGAALHALSSMSPGTVFLVDASILHQIDKPSAHYYDYRLLDLRTDDSQRLTFSGSAGVQWELERVDDAFVFLRPEPLKGASVSSSEIRLFLHNLSAIGADNILPRADRQPPGRPAFTLEILLGKAAEPLRLEIFPIGEAEEVFGRSSRHPGGFTLEREKARSLVRLAYDMQWRGVITFDSAQVEGARIYSVMGNQTLTVSKTATGWEDREHGVRIAGLDMSLWRLKELRFEAEPVSRLAYPAVQRLILDILSREGKVLSSFVFYSDPRLPADQCWLKVGAEEMYYPVGNQIIEELQGYLPQRPVRPPGG